MRYFKANRALKTLLTGITLTLISACGGDDAAPPNRGDSTATPKPPAASTSDLTKHDCSQLKLTHSQAVPLSELGLLNLPKSLLLDNKNGGAYLQYRNGTRHDLVMSYYPEYDQITVNVPLIDNQYFSDQSAQLFVVDAAGKLLCPAQTLTVKALPAAPSDTLRQTVDRIGQQLEQQRQALGITRAALSLDGTSTLSPEAYALALAYYAYDAPSNPNALTKIADGTATIRQDRQFDPDLFNRLLLASGVPDLMAQQMAIRTATKTATLTKSAGNPAIKVDIDNFETLKQYMEDQQKAEGLVAPNGIFSQTFNDVALANSLGSIVTGPYGLAFGSVLYSGKLALDYRANLYPSTISDLDMDYQARITHEDDANTYQYQNIKLVAQSKGWDITYTLIDGVLTLAGGARGTSAVVQESKAAGQAITRVIPSKTPAKDGLSLGDTLLDASRADQIQAGAEVVSNLSSRAESNPVTGLVTIPAFEWRDIPIRSDQFDAVEVRQGLAATPAIEITDAKAGQYRAIHDGTALLMFSLKIHYKLLRPSKPVTVDAIKILMQPTRTSHEIFEGEQLCFSADMLHAQDNKGQFRVSGPQGQASINGLDYCFKAPAKVQEEWSKPVLCSLDSILMPEFYRVDFEAMTRTGARSPQINPAWQPRLHSISIQVKPKPENHANAKPPARPECEQDDEPLPDTSKSPITWGEWTFTVLGQSCPTDSAFDVTAMAGLPNHSIMRFNAEKQLVIGDDFGLLAAKPYLISGMNNRFTPINASQYQNSYSLQGILVAEHTLSIISPTQTRLSRTSYFYPERGETIVCTAEIEGKLDNAIAEDVMRDIYGLTF